MITTKLQNKIRGSLVGGAVGDALGYPVEFMSLSAIRNKYGERGITNFELDERGLAVVSDDTQMTLFTANGLMFGVTRSNNYGVVADLPFYVMEAYKEWYQTQTRVEDYNAFHTCWIRDIKELNVCRAPGNTCLSALRDVNNVSNNSKGCGGIMRVAPVALYLSSENERAARHGDATYFPQESIDKYAGECAAITHKHPLGYMSAALFVDVLYQLLNTEERVTFDMVCQYVESALSTLMNLYTSKAEATALGELWYISKRAIELAKKDMEDTEAIRELGEGWVAEETWAIALYCVLKHLDSIEDAIIAAVNHDGDSDSTGSVCGNLMGVIVGYDGIPEKYKTNIELKNVMLAIADDMVHGCNISEYHPAETMDDKQWEQRYIFANLMLKPIVNSYAVTDWLYAGEYPGDKDAGKLRDKIEQFKSFGITHFIDLTEEGELFPYEQLLPDTIKHVRFPIVDQSIPKNTESVRRLLDSIINIHNENPAAKVYIHCWGGVGRTGTVVGCFVGYYLQLNYDETMMEFKRLWRDCPKSAHRVSPENLEQHHFIADFIAELEKSKESAALLTWTNGLGHMGKAFNGEDAMPEKMRTATADSWDILPMPEEHTIIRTDIKIPSDAMDIIRKGHIPDAMEDHWFMYCDEEYIRYYRSWTGICIYEARYEKADDGYRLTSIIANRLPEQYSQTNDRRDYCMFMYLLITEAGGDGSSFFNEYLSLT